MRRFTVCETEQKKNLQASNTTFFLWGEKCGQPEYLSGFPDTQFKIKKQERVKETWQALLVQ